MQVTQGHILLITKYIASLQITLQWRPSHELALDFIFSISIVLKELKNFCPQNPRCVGVERRTYAISTAF